MVILAGPAVKLTGCWPKATTPPNRRTPPTRTAAFKVALKLLVLMGSLMSSVGLVNHKFPGINQHHHQHSAGENIVGGDLALVVRVPHKRKASLIGRRVRDRARRWSGTGGPNRSDGRIRTLACPVENPIHRLSRRGGGGEQQRSGEGRSGSRIGRAQNQVPIAPQDAHMVPVLVERMLPPALADDAQQDLLARMHVRIAV